MAGGTAECQCRARFSATGVSGVDSAKATRVMVKGAMLGERGFIRVVSVNQMFCILERLLLHIAEGLELGG
jgi:hypothetical protein